MKINLKSYARNLQATLLDMFLNNSLSNYQLELLNKLMELLQATNFNKYATLLCIKEIKQSFIIKEI